MIHRRHRASAREYVIAGLLMLAFLWLVYLVWGIAQKEEIARHAAYDAKHELESLKARESTLEENLAELETPRGEEATLRESFGVARPGEEVIIVVPSSEPPGPPLPWWRKVLGWFGL